LHFSLDFPVPFRSFDWLTFLDQPFSFCRVVLFAYVNHFVGEFLAQEVYLFDAFHLINV